MVVIDIDKALEFDRMHGDQFASSTIGSQIPWCTDWGDAVATHVQ